MSRPLDGAREIHPQHCDCNGCEPWHVPQGSRITDLERVSVFAIAGIGAGIVIVQTIAFLIGAPGIRLVFGL